MILLKEWKIYLQKKLLFIIISVVLFILSVILIFYTLNYVENRPGNKIFDPILNILPSYNLSNLLFFLTYTGSLIGILICINYPKTFLITLLTYTQILIYRSISMYLTPLEPPEGIIPLRDIFLEKTFYVNKINLKDLFFSGHTATITMFLFTIEDFKWKIFFLIYSILIATCLLFQHAHYSIDVFIAPFISFTSYSISKSIFYKYLNFTKSNPSNTN